MNVPSSFKLLESENRKVNKELVDEFYNTPPSVTERDLDEKRCAALNERILSGLAIAFLWVRVKVKGQPGYFRMNGQHSSTVLKRLSDEDQLPDGLIAHLDTYEVQDLPTAVQLFRQFDSRLSSRTPLDVTNAYASVNEQLHNINRKYLKLGAEGIWWYRKYVEHESDTASGDDRFEIVMDSKYTDFLRWLCPRTDGAHGGILSIKTPEMKNSAVVAAAYATFALDPTLATEFWQNVAKAIDGEVDSDEPATVLDDWLRRVKEGKIENMRAGHIYQACISAWNAHVDERRITRLVTEHKKGYLSPKYPAPPLKKAA